MKRAIAILTRGYEELERYKALLNRNKTIEENVNESYDYLVFHEGNITKDQQKYIQSNTNLPLEFIDIPRFLSRDHAVFQPTAPWGWNYRHMCNFWFSGFLDYVKDYDQLLRIDEDCTIYSNLDQVFDSLNNKVCSYARWVDDDWFNVFGLDDFCKKFSNKPRKEIGGPYTNLVAWDLNKVRENTIVNDFIQAVNESNGIYVYRWGDHMLWGEALHYGFEESDHVLLKTVKYYHASCLAKVNYETEEEVGK